MRHVLLPTDFSDNSWSAIKYAVELFIQDGAVFHLLNAFSPYIVSPTGPIEAHVMDEMVFRAAEENSKRGLADFKERILEEFPYANIETHAKFDFFTHSIHRILLEHEIKCIVLGTKGASGIKEIVMGSNTSSLIGKVKVPILAIPEETLFEPIHKVVLCSDLSVTPTEKGIEPLLNLLKLTNASLEVLSVFKTDRELNKKELEVIDVYRKLFANFKINFIRNLDPNIESGINTYIKESKADVVCSIAKKHSFLERLLEKSQSKALTNHTRVPLLVLNEALF